MNKRSARKTRLQIHSRVLERIHWLLDQLDKMPCKGCAAWHSDFVDEFVKSFPESEKTLVVYTLGPNSCPMLNQAARKACKMGYLRAGVIGCQDARSYNQRTWARYWSLTGKKWR